MSRRAKFTNNEPHHVAIRKEHDELSACSKEHLVGEYMRSNKGADEREVKSRRKQDIASDILADKHGAEKVSAAFATNESVTESYTEAEAEQALHKAKTYTPKQHADDLRAVAAGVKQRANGSGPDSILHNDAYHLNDLADAVERGDHAMASHISGRMETACREEIPPHVYMHIGGTILTKNGAYNKSGPVKESHNMNLSNEIDEAAYTGQHSGTANAGYGFHGEMYNDHEEGKKDSDASEHAARQFALMHKHLVTKHGIDPKLARNLLDSKYGRWMADSIRGTPAKSGHTVGKPLSAKACAFAVSDNFRTPGALQRAVREIKSATDQGRFEESAHRDVEMAKYIHAFADQHHKTGDAEGVSREDRHNIRTAASDLHVIANDIAAGNHDGARHYAQNVLDQTVLGKLSDDVRKHLLDHGTGEPVKESTSKSPLPAPVTPEGFTHTVRFHLEPQFVYKNKAERNGASFEDDANHLHDYARDNGISLIDHNDMGKFSIGRPSEKTVTYHPAHGSSFSTYSKNGEVKHPVSEERPHHYVDVHVKGADVARAFSEAGGHMMKSLASETYKGGKRIRANTDDYMGMRVETHMMGEAAAPAPVVDKKADALKVVENDANGYLNGIMPNGDANTGLGFQVLPHIDKNIRGHVAKLKKDLGMTHGDALAAVAGHYDAASANCAKSGDKRGAYCLSKMADHARGIKETTAESVLGRPDQTKATVSVLTNNKLLHVGQPGVHMAHFHLKHFDKLNSVAAAPGGMAQIVDDTGREYDITHDEDGVMRFGGGSSGQFFVHAEKVRRALAPHVGAQRNESIEAVAIATTAKLLKG